MEQHAEQWNLIIKVKHGDTLRRIGAHVHGKLMDHNMTKLRAKICSLFKFSHDADLILTYTDVDGDIVTLDNDDELSDAVISQRLNPLRITVELKSKPDTSSAESSPCETTPVTNVQSEPFMDLLMTVLSNLFNVADKAISNSPVSEVIKSEPFKSVLDNIHKDVKKATSFSPALSNLADQLSKIVNQTEPVCESSSSTPPTSVVPSNPLDLNVPCASKPFNFPTQVTNEIADSVKNQSNPEQTANAARPLYPLEELLCTTAKKYPDNCEGTESGSSDGRGKNTVTVHGPFDLEQSYGYTPSNPSSTLATSNDKNTLNKTQIYSESSIHPNTLNNREDGALRSSTHFHPGSYVTEESLYHMGVQCDGCGTLPIKGPRFKSKVLEDYDLCNVCYNQIPSRKGRKMDYIKIDLPRIAPRLSFKGKHSHVPTASSSSANKHTESVMANTSSEKSSSKSNEVILQDTAKKKVFNICLHSKSGGVVMVKKSLFDINKEKRKQKESLKDAHHEHLRSGMVLLRKYISHEDQVQIVKKCQELGIGEGGFYKPGYDDGAKLLLHMMCLGRNWDPQSRLYEDKRSIDGATPPVIPEVFKKLVSGAIDAAHEVIKQKDRRRVEAELPSMSPDICIVNFYTNEGKLGLHQDKDESEESIRAGLPVVSFSIGDSAEFLYSDERDESTAKKVLLESGDVLIFGGKSRRIFHGVPCINKKTAPQLLIEETNLRPGRLNLTFKQY